MCLYACIARAVHRHLAQPASHECAAAAAAAAVEAAAPVATSRSGSSSARQDSRAPTPTAGAGAGAIRGAATVVAGGSCLVMDPRQDHALRSGWSLGQCLSLLSLEGAQVCAKHPARAMH